MQLSKEPQVQPYKKLFFLSYKEDIQCFFLLSYQLQVTFLWFPHHPLQDRVIDRTLELGLCWGKQATGKLISQPINIKNIPP